MSNIIDHLIGVICEMNEDSYKVFDWTTKKMRELSHQVDPTLEVGDCLEFGGTTTELRLFDDPDFDIEVDIEGSLYIETYGMYPPRSKSQIQRKYKNAIWTAFFDVVGDKDSIFREMVEPETLGKVTIKYEPDGASFFKVVKVEGVEDDSLVHLSEMFNIAPWILEATCPEISEIAKPKPDDWCFHKDSTIGKENLFVGLAVSRQPSTFTEEKKKGVEWILLFNPILGSIRCDPDDLKNKPTISIGQFYSFNVKDKRIFSNRRNQEKEVDLDKKAFAALTATNVKPEEMEKIPIREKDGKAVLVTSFLFDMEKFEGLDKVHFFDFVCGKVDIPKETARAILDKVVEKTSDLERDNIVIIVEVTSAGKRRLQNYPTGASFTVSEILMLIRSGTEELIAEFN